MGSIHTAQLKMMMTDTQNNASGEDGSLGAIVKRRLHDLRKTQEWLRKEMGVSSSAVSQWISTGKISEYHLKRLAVALQVDSTELPAPTSSVVPVPRGVKPSGDASLLHRLTPEEYRIIDVVRRTTKDHRIAIMAMINVAAKHLEDLDSLGFVKSDQTDGPSGQSS